MRVVSLVPSATETLLAVGADVVACTRFCEQPALQDVGGTKNPDLDAIRELAPDAVVMDRQENRIEDAEVLEASGLRLVVTDVCSVDDAFAAVVELSALAGVGPPPPFTPEPAGRTLRVFVPIWRRPWMSIGRATYGGSVLSALGCRLLTDASETHYPVVELDAVAGADPDAVLVPSEPYDFDERHLVELREVFPRAHVRRVDGQDLFWWGTRTPVALERLGRELADLA